MEKFKIGDKVRCKVPGSWVDGKVGEIIHLDVTSSDGIHGYLLQMDGSQTVVPPEELEPAL